MVIKINDTQILFQSIESLRYDPENHDVVLRTMSGIDYFAKRNVTESEANSLIDSIVKNIAMCQS